MLTQKFFNSLRNHGKPLHEIAWASGITPNQLYKISSGVDRPHPNDPRVRAICEYIGLPVREAFPDDNAGDPNDKPILEKHGWKKTGSIGTVNGEPASSTA